MGYCNQTLAGIPFDCSNSLGGIKAVYIANHSDVDGFTYENDTMGKIKGLVMKDNATFKPYRFRKQTGSMTSTLTVDETAGVNYVTTELSLVFGKMETTKRLEIAALSKGQLAVIVEDSNGIFWYLGEDEYVSASAGGGNTGTAKGDQNAYTITLKDESLSFPKEIEKSGVMAVVED